MNVKWMTEIYILSVVYLCISAFCVIDSLLCRVLSVLHC